MAYSGSTAGSTSANPPRKLTDGVAGNQGTTGLTTAPNNASGQGGALWFYTSTNATTDLTGANFFTDGKSLGMRPGDAIICVSFTSAGSSVQLAIGAITGVSTSGASLSTGSLITSTFA